MKDLRSIVTKTIVENTMVEIDNTGQERYTLNEEQFGLLVDNLVKNMNAMRSSKMNYLESEAENQIKRMEQLGINTTGQMFEQMVNSLIFELEQVKNS